MNRLLAVLLLALFVSQGRAQVPTAPQPCANGYTFAFFNGVGNSYADAQDGMEALRKWGFNNGEDVDLLAEFYANEDVKFEAFYNHTGSAVSGGALQDVAEVFNQRAAELDSATGSWSGAHLYLFWDQVDALVGTPGYAHAASSADAGFSDLLAKFVTSQINVLLDDLALLFSPPTLADYAQHKGQLDGDVASGRKLVMVAHSQGNLFVNQAYDYVQPQIGSNLVKVVHIAPASPTLRGPWELADIDLVINGLRLRNGAAKVPDVNLYLQSFNNDPTGHTLVGTYLDPSRAGLAKTQGLIADAFRAISPAPCAMAVTPANSPAKAGDMIGLTAKMINPILNPHAIVGYKWQVSGNANGTLKDPVTGNISTLLETSSASVTYIASSNAVQGLLDTVTVTTYVENELDTAVPRGRKEIATATSTINFGTATRIAPSGPTLDLGEVKTFTAVVAPAPPQGMSYRWTLSGDGSIGSASSVTSSSNAITYTAPNSAGSATLSVDVLDSNGGTLSSDSTSITILGTNGCYNISGFLAQPGSTFSETFTILGGTGATTPVGSQQRTYGVKANVAITNPAATTALEQDTTDVTTHFAPDVTVTSAVASFYGVTSTSSGLGSAVEYGTTVTNTDSTKPGATATIVVTFTPPVPFVRNSLTPGQSATVTYTGTATNTASTAGSGSTTTNYDVNMSQVWTYLGRETVTVDAGTYDTCKFQMYDTARPTDVTTYSDIVGYGITVKEEDVSDTSSGSGVTDIRKATSVTINGSRY
ncbi:MAG TPA: hypothetical protein VGM84_06785 [Steroidobacteraceae bacterium]